jgi:hypothetical protein
MAAKNSAGLERRICAPYMVALAALSLLLGRHLFERRPKRAIGYLLAFEVRGRELAKQRLSLLAIRLGIEESCKVRRRRIWFFNIWRFVVTGRVRVEVILAGPQSLNVRLIDPDLHNELDAPVDLARQNPCRGVKFYLQADCLPPFRRYDGAPVEWSGGQSTSLEKRIKRMASPLILPNGKAPLGDQRAVRQRA